MSFHDSFKLRLVRLAPPPISSNIANNVKQCSLYSPTLLKVTIIDMYLSIMVSKSLDFLTFLLMISFSKSILAKSSISSSTSTLRTCHFLRSSSAMACLSCVKSGGPPGCCVGISLVVGGATVWVYIR